MAAMRQARPLRPRGALSNMGKSKHSKVKRTHAQKRQAKGHAPLKVGVLISGSGTNLQAIIDKAAAGKINVEVVRVIASKPDAYGLQRAVAAGIPAFAMQKSDYDDPQAADAEIVRQMREAGAEYLVMAGYMRKVTNVILDAFPDKVVNLHPALLPSFVGAHAIADAYEAGVKVTGVTVHFANAEYDKGPIIAQKAVKVHEDDTMDLLEARIHRAEHKLYPKVLGWLADGRVSLDDHRKVHIE